MVRLPVPDVLPKTSAAAPWLSNVPPVMNIDPIAFVLPLPMTRARPEVPVGAKIVVPWAEA